MVGCEIELEATEIRTSLIWWEEFVEGRRFMGAQVV